MPCEPELSRAAEGSARDEPVAGSACWHRALFPFYLPTANTTCPKCPGVLLKMKPSSLPRRLTLGVQVNIAALFDRGQPVRSTAPSVPVVALTS